MVPSPCGGLLLCLPLQLCAADLQLKMGAATRNLSLALQQCDVKQNMAIRSKLVSHSSDLPVHGSLLMTQQQVK